MHLHAKQENQVSEPGFLNTYFHLQTCANE